MRALWEGVRAGFESAVLRPLQDGRPRLHEGPLALRLLLWFSLPISVALFIVFMVGYYAFEESTNTTVLDAAPLWFGIVLTTWTMVFAFLLAPLLPRGGRITAWVLLALALTPQLATTYHRLSLAWWGPVVMAVAILGVGMLVVAAVVGCRRGGETMHVVLTVAGVGATILFPLLMWQSLPEGVSTARGAMAFFALALIVLAGPMMIAGSMAFVQLSIEVSYAGARGFGRFASRPALIAVFCVLAGGGAFYFSLNVLLGGNFSLGGVLVDVLVVGLSLLIFRGVMVWARHRRRPLERPQPDTMMDHFGTWVGVWGLTLYLSSLLYSAFQQDWLMAPGMLTVGIWGMVRSIRRGQPAAALVHTAVTMMTTLMLLARAMRLPGLTEAGISVVLVVAISGYVVVAAARGHVTNRRMLIATIAMAVVVLFTLRTVIFQPLELFGATTVGVVLIGVFWLAATTSSGRGTTRGRVQQALVLVGTATALMVDPRAITALTDVYEFGEGYVSRLMVVAVVAGLWEMWRYHLDPEHGTQPAPAPLQNAPVNFVGAQSAGR